MRKGLAVLVLVGLIVTCLEITPSCAGEVDVLLQKLVDKGILNASEAQQIKTETNEEIAKTEKQKLEDYKALPKDALPDWVKNTKLKGDFRLRYQLDKDKGQENWNRVRIRARLGIESKVNDKLITGVGIATGKAGDPRSTNITLGNDPAAANTPGSYKSVILNYAYGQYMPFDWFTFIGGKFNNNIWQPTDLLWDTDLNPEGVGLSLSYKANPALEFFINNQFFWLRNDTRSDKQPTMFAEQPGFNWTINNKVSLKSALAIYEFIAVRNTAKFATYDSTNTLINNNYKYNYNSINPSLELGFKDPFSGLVPYASIFADYVYNYSSKVDSSKDGFDAGFKFGYKDIKDWGQWQAKAICAKLGRDAWLDIFPDSDRYNGKTNMKSIKVEFNYGLGKNTFLGLDYYYARSLNKASEATGYAPQQVLQVDWNMKF